jgi:ferric-dicitrate binding protein FerR (iron transport regulator)
MTLKARHAACERARVWAALLPDGELSLFEQRLLDAHCAHCAECRHLLESIGGLTDVIRATTIEEMDRHVRILRPRPAYWRSASRVLTSGSAAALALGLAFWVGPQQAHPGPAPASTAPVIILTPESSAADSAAIWELKQARIDGPVTGGDVHRPGRILK